jgi:hypothetical protein
LTIARGPLTTVSPTGTVSENDIGGNLKDFRILPNDTLLMANVEGLMLMHRDNRDASQRIMLRKGRCQKVAVGKDGTLWAACRDGLFSVQSPHQWQPVKWNGTRIYGTDLREDDSGGVWVGTISEGVFHFKENGETVHLSVENGLTTNETHAIFITSDTLWIANNRGLDRVVGTEVTFFGLQDGLEVNETNALLIDGGSVYLARHDGLVRFPTSLNPTNTAPPRLHLTAVMARDSALSADAMPVLTHDLNDLRITLAVAAFRSRGNTLVRYRLLGLDTAWAETIGNRADIRYNALAEGDFTFEAYALNEDGIRSAETIVLTFTVLPPLLPHMVVLPALRARNRGNRGRVLLVAHQAHSRTGRAGARGRQFAAHRAQSADEPAFPLQRTQLHSGTHLAEGRGQWTEIPRQIQ